MLARSAQGLYWMSRYLERAQRLCRLLRLQVEALVDRPLREIRCGWQRIFEALGSAPPPGSLEAFDSDDYTLADSYTLADHLTFERLNPDSIWSCFALGRANAYQLRRCISAEMWTRLNRAYLHLRELEIHQIWRAAPESFYADTAAQVDTFAGVAAATMYRDAGWRFLRLGRYVERAQLAAALLLAQLEVDRRSGDSHEADWISLLRCCDALEAYHRGGGITVEPARVLDLLVTDPLLPGSLRHALDAAAAELAAIGPGPHAAASAATLRAAQRLSALIRDAWPERRDRGALLRQVHEHGRNLHLLVADTYFDYPVAGLPGLPVPAAKAARAGR